MHTTIESTGPYQGYIQADKTLFTFVDEAGDKSTLTLDKFVADGLQGIVEDVHAWIQKQYDEIIAAVRQGKEKISRRAIGDEIRSIALKLYLDSIDDSELE